MSVIMMLTMVPSIAFAAVGPYSVRAYAVDAGGKIDTSDGSYVELNDMLTDGKDRPTSDEMLAALKGAGAVADSVTAEQLNFEFYNGDDGNIKKINKGTATVYGFTKEALKLGYIACTYSVDEAEPVEQSVNFNVYVDARGANKGSEPIVISKTFTDGQTYNDILPTDKEILEAAGAVDGQTARYSSPWFGDTAWSAYLSASWNDAKNMEGFNLTNEAKDGGSLNINVQLTDLVTINVTYYLVASDNMADGQYIASATADVYDGEALPDAAVLFSDKDITGDDKVYSWIKAADWAAMGTDRTLNDVKNAAKVNAADADTDAYVAVLEKRGNIDGAAVSFDVNGGNDITGNYDNVKVGDSITLPTTTRSGWTFLGWYVNGKYAGMGDEKYTVNEAVDFTAQWEGDVTFNIWEYSDVDGDFDDNAKLTSVELTVNTVDGVPTVDEVIAKLWGTSVEIGRDDKVYGWYTTDIASEIAEKTDKIDNYTTVSGADEITNGYANAFVVRDASAEYVTLTLEPNGGSFDGVTNNNKKINVIAGRALTAEQLEGPNNTPKNYGNLYGWFDADGNQVKAGDSIDANTTLYAKYSKDVTLYLYDINAVDNNNSQTKTVEVVLDEEIGDMTSVFDNASAPLQVEANDEVYGWYTSDVWTNIYKNGADAIKAAASVKTAKADDDSIAYFAVVDKDANAERVTASYDFNGGKTSSGLSEWEPITNIVSGTKVLLPELTNDGWEIAGWQDDKGNTVSEDAVITEDTTYTAQWEKSVTYYLFDSTKLGEASETIAAVEKITKGETLPAVNDVFTSITSLDSFTGWYTQDDWAWNDTYTEKTAVTEADDNGAYYVAVVTKNANAERATVTFDVNGGTMVNSPDSVQVIKGEKIWNDYPNDPTLSDWTFDGWYDESGIKYTVDSIISEDVTLTAKWTRDITFWVMTDGIDNPVNLTVSCVKGESLPEINAMLAEHGISVTDDDAVAGWFEQSVWDSFWANDGAYDGLFGADAPETADVADSASYVAAIKKDGQLADCTVTFDSNGGSDVEAKTVKAGKLVTEPATPTKDNRTFAGWYLVKQNGEVAKTQFDFSKPVTGDVKLIARWNRTVHYWFYKDAVIEDTGKEIVRTFPEEQDIPNVTELPNDFIVDGEYTIHGWYSSTDYEYGQEVSDLDALTPVDFGNYNVYDNSPEWGCWVYCIVETDASKVTVSFDNVLYGDSIEPVKTTKGAGIAAVEPENVQEGYKFVEWVNGSDAVDLTTATFSENTTLKAKWAVEVTYKVYSNNNFVNAEDDSEWVAIKLSGESMPVTKTATHGWYTEGDWEQIAAQGEYDYSDFETVTRVSEPITLYGMNVSGHTITFSAGTGIKATGIPSMQTVEYGQRLADEVISAVPERTDISMEFKGWTIDGINAVDLTEYIVTGDAQFTALWGKKEYTVEFNNPQAIGSFTGSTSTVIYGEKVVAPEVDVPDGYQLEGWYTSEDYTEGTKFDGNTAITADYTLYARWSAEVTYNLYNSKSTLKPERVMTEFIPLGNQANLGDKADEVTEGFLYGWFDAATWENVVANKIPNFDVNWEQYKLNYGEFEVNEPVSVYGKYAKTFNVTFSAGEVIKADNMPDAQQVLEGGYASEPAEIPIKDGYVFVGWNFNFANTKITADTVIEATWVAAEYKITYDANGGYFAPNFTPEKTISYGEKYGMLPNSAQVMKSGSTLKGWTKDIEAEPIVLVKANDMYDVYGDTTLYAVWDNSKVQVTYVANGGAVTGVASGTEQVDYGTVITREAEKAGLVFEGWYYDAALTQKYNDEPVIEATTLYAKYQAQITFRVYENATRDNTLVEPKIVMVDEYDEIALPAAEELGVEMGSTDEFIGWYTETEFNKLTAGENASVFTGNADTEMTLYANIVRHYTVTFDFVGGTEIAAQDVRYNGFATEPEAPKKEGNTFIGWYVGEAAEAYDFATPVTGDLVLTAKWNTNIYTVTFKSGVGGVDDVIDYVYHGSLFNTGNAGVPAFERLGYTQDGWLLDGVKYDETAPVKGNLTLTANWIMNEFTAVIDGTYTFTGSAITPAVIVTDNTTGDKLVSELYTVTYDVDATVEGNNAKMYFDKPLNAGAYTATVAPVAFGGYDACEAVKIKFVISQADINEASLGFYLGYDDEVDDTVAYDPDNLFKYEYTGSPIEGLVDIWTLDINGEPNEQLEVNTDYSLAYENDITSAGEKTVTVSGTGNYTGTKELKYVITKVNINISDYYATITPEYFIFNGEAQQPSVTVKPNEQADNSLVLEYGTDYTVGYIAPDGVDLVNGAPVYPGLYTVVIEGLGNYEGQVTTKPQYTIYRKGVASEDITVEIVDGPEFDYAGAPVTPEVVVKDTTRNITLVKDTDYSVAYFNNNGIGEASVKITGINNYDSERTEAFWIVGPKEISEATIAEIEDVIYDGSAQEPELTITDGDYALVKGTDYTVAYSDNVNAGQATITVTGIGKYTGTKEEFFDINARSIENAEITGVEDKYSATGLAIEPTVTVTDDLGNVLVITNDYTVAYVDNTAVGTATITVTGLGNYTGTKIITFEIVNSVFYTTGIVKYASGNPVVGGTVTLKGTTKDGTPVSRSTTTDSTGRYYFTDLKDGSYTVTYKKSKVSAILNPGSPQ